MIGCKGEVRIGKDLIETSHEVAVSEGSTCGRAHLDGVIIEGERGNVHRIEVEGQGADSTCRVTSISYLLGSVEVLFLDVTLLG